MNHIVNSIGNNEKSIISNPHRQQIVVSVLFLLFFISIISFQSLSIIRLAKNEKSPLAFLIAYLEKKKKTHEIDGYVPLRFRYLEKDYFSSINVQIPFIENKSDFLIYKHDQICIPKIVYYYKIYKNNHNIIILNYSDNIQHNAELFNMMITDFKKKYIINRDNYRDFLKFLVFATFDSDKPLYAFLVENKTDLLRAKKLLPDISLASDPIKKLEADDLYPSFKSIKTNVFRAKFVVFAGDFYYYDIYLTNGGKIIKIKRERIGVIF